MCIRDSSTRGRFGDVPPRHRRPRRSGRASRAGASGASSRTRPPRTTTTRNILVVTQVVVGVSGGRKLPRREWYDIPPLVGGAPAQGWGGDTARRSAFHNSIPPSNLSDPRCAAGADLGFRRPTSSPSSPPSEYPRRTRAGHAGPASVAVASPSKANYEDGGSFPRTTAAH